MRQVGPHPIDAVVRARLGASALDALSHARELLGEMNRFLVESRVSSGSLDRSRIDVRDGELVVPLDAVDFVRHWLVVAPDARLHGISFQLRGEPSALRWGT